MNESNLQFLSFVHEETSGLAEQSAVDLQNDVTDMAGPDLKGNTPLHLAAKKGDAELVRRFLEAGANVNVRNYVIKDKGNQTVTGDETPLHLAALGGHLEVVQILIQYEANLNAFSGRSTKLYNFPIDFISFLIIFLITISDLTALHNGAQSAAVSCLQALLDAKSNPNAVNRDGRTALLLLGRAYSNKSNGIVTGYSEGVESLVNAAKASVNVCERDTAGCNNGRLFSLCQ